ncbi:MAG: hypothetical protein F6J96_21480 [Symploca sp. SIO1C2]|nr:hypothetical protein [Symploca sp. SIO1C2]
MSAPIFPYICDIGGDVKGILGDVKAEVINQYIIAQKSEAEIHSQRLKKGSPYLGLKKFEPEDKDKFFGREQWITKLSKDLEQDNLLLLLGASGSGKSSLVQAGIIPYLSDEWGTSKLIKSVFVPYKNPFKSLYNSLQNNHKNIANQIFEEKSSDCLIKLFNKLKDNSQQWLIFIDQFEELFTITPKIERDKFITNLVLLIRQKDSSLKLVLAMRSDFLDNLREYADFINEIEEQIRLIRDLNESELRLAIAEPAARNGVTFEKGLVEQIISDFDKQAGSLPLLQYTLDLLWEKSGISDNSRVLNIEIYDDLDGVGGALEKQAEYIYKEKLNTQEKKVAEKIFIELIDIVKKEPISRRVEQSQFINDPIKESVLNKLIESRLLVSGRDKSTTVEVAHEELLRSWKFIRDLIEEQEEVILLRKRLIDDTYQWCEVKKQNLEKAKDELWSGSKLERVFELINKEAFGSLDKDSNQFIQESIEQRDYLAREKEYQRQRELEAAKKITILAVSVAALCIIASIAGIFAWSQRKASLQVVRDVAVGLELPSSDLLDILPDFLQEASKRKEKGDIDRAIAYYNYILTAADKLQKRIVEKPKEFPNFSKTKLEEIQKTADASLLKMVHEHRLSFLEEQLKQGLIGEREEPAPGNLEKQYTEGAIKTTYKILMRPFGYYGDLNNDGFLDKPEEAERIPCETLQKIEQLWRKYTKDRCGWYGTNSHFENLDCQELVRLGEEEILDTKTGQIINKTSSYGGTLLESVFDFPFNSVIERIDSCHASAKPINQE